MPRVHTRTRKRVEVKRPMRCSKCYEPIEVGQSYYTWAQRFGGPQYQHTACGYPRPSQLSNAKTAQIEDAIADTDLSSWSPEIPSDWDGSTDSIAVDLDHLRSLLEGVASTARDVGSEYEESADNMPESLQYGSQAEAMREVAQELESWADDIESFDPYSDEPDWPERDEDESDEKWRERVEEALEQWVGDVRDEAESKLGDMPYYQG